MQLKTTLPLCITAILALSACDKAVDGSNAAASITGKAINDAADTWTDAFTLHPRPKPQQPQTRYCYKMMTDIVCYDSVQTSLTAKLIGYQDGASMSWIQPGGGSLGASGGAPVSYQQQAPNAVRPTIIAVSSPLENTPVAQANGRGEIQSINLPPEK